MNLVKAELFKIRSTSTWWILGLITLGRCWRPSRSTGSAAPSTTPPGGQGSPEQAAQVRAADQAVNRRRTSTPAASSSALLMVMLLGVIVVTNEFFHQTATTTFLATPRRESVMIAKLIAATLLGVLFWLVTTLLNLRRPFILIRERRLQLGERRSGGRSAQRAGLRALGDPRRGRRRADPQPDRRDHHAGTIYVIGSFGAATLFFLLTRRARRVVRASCRWSGPAVGLAVDGLRHRAARNPPRWVGAVVLIGYAVVAGGLGTWLMKRRDIA